MSAAVQSPFRQSRPPGKARDGRRRERLKISLPVQARPFDPRFSEIIDVGEVTDFTRHGLYFVSCMPHYFLGMRLILKFPYGEKFEAHKKFLGNVVRLEDRPDGSRGVAVQFVI